MTSHSALPFSAYHENENSPYCLCNIPLNSRKENLILYRAEYPQVIILMSSMEMVL